ncbi:hypothetical protein D9M70_631050 [compost metagenome]
MGLFGHETHLVLLQLGTQPRRLEDLQLGGHHLHQEDFQAPPDGALLFLVIEVPVHHLVMEALATATHQVAVDSGAEADARRLDALVGHAGNGFGR